MIDVITKIVCALLCGYTFFHIYKKILKDENSLIKEILTVLILSIIIYFSYVTKYNSDITIFKFIIFIIIFKIFYKETVYKALISTLLSLTIILISDILISFIFNFFVNVNELRGLWYIVLISNILTCLTAIILINNNHINTILSKIILKISQKSKMSYILILILSILMVIYTVYNISLNYNWSEKYIINILITISYIVIVIIFFKDKLEYTMLEEKYDMLFDYFSELAENIDDLNLTTHEYKNQIAIVGNYIENKKYNKAKEYINDISNSINKDEKLFVNLTDIPTGGLKGLLYYKIVVAKNQKVEIILDVGKNIKKTFKKLSEDQMKIITRIIGVYIDNAVSGTKNKRVNIEIYNLDNELYFTISNKVKKDFDINNIGKRGFTTKGKGHGKGIYLTNKLISRNKWLNSENRLINDYYISKLIIDTKNIG